MRISYAPDAWKLLNGIFCIYKPADLYLIQILETVKLNLCRDLNLLKPRPQKRIIKCKGNAEEGNLTVTNVPNLADNPLVIGPYYQPLDIRLNRAHYLDKLTSGLAVIGINRGCFWTRRIKAGNYLRKYEVSGQFGFATTTFHETGKIREKTTYDHIHTSQVDRVLASWQAAHQRLMFQHAGVDLKTQAAYELASRGPIRPAAESGPLIYSLKCTKLELPNIILEVTCINEDELYLMKIIHELGLSLKSTASCTKVRLTQFGPFTMDLALLRKQLTLENIINNIIKCEQIIKSQNLQPETPFFDDSELYGDQKLLEGESMKQIKSK